MVVMGDGLVHVSASYGFDVTEGRAADFTMMGHGQSGATIIADLTETPFALHPLVTGPPYLRSMVQLPVRSRRTPRAGTVCVASPTAGLKLGAAQLGALRDVIGVLGEALEWERRHVQLLMVTRRAARADRMLRQVSEAESCADALTSMLGELCQYHGALVGRIWRLMNDGTMQEVSRFNASENSHTYYQALPSEPVRAGNSKTAEAIRLNEPLAFNYSDIPNTDRYALMPAAIAAGLASQVSYPICVQEQRFGVSLAFTTERTDLEAIVADIASLANSIRPALFRKVTEERIRHMAHHDELTQLGNRAVLNERLRAAVDEASRAVLESDEERRDGSGLALLYLDLDGFKLVNDTRGHEVGDKLLAAVAGRLRASVREGDTIARIGGDEFAIVLPAAGQPHAATQLARRLLQAIARPFEIDGQPSVVGMSIGIALHPADGDTPDVLQRNADAALYEAKQGGRNTFRRFERSAGLMQRERTAIERDLKLAVEQDRLSLAYQPIVESGTRRLRGLEALLRWTHPTRGELSPLRFVPLAESSGMIIQLGQWVLQTACAEASTWPRPVCLSANLSPVQFRDAGLARQIEAILASTGLPPERLDLEITEGLLLDDSVVRTMHSLREQGVHLTLDDFGAAYSGLSYLRRFPFDRIKIDRHFVQDLTTDVGTRAIVETMLTLGERLNLEVVAEGVETDEQLAILQGMGCRLVQGYLTGRPMPRDAASALAQEQSAVEPVG